VLPWSEVSDMLTPRSRALLNASFSALLLPKSAEPKPPAESPRSLEDAAPLTGSQHVPLDNLPDDPGDEGVPPRLG
jgi:hypothetical protein